MFYRTRFGCSVAKKEGSDVNRRCWSIFNHRRERNGRYYPGNVNVSLDCIGKDTNVRYPVRGRRKEKEKVGKRWKDKEEQYWVKMGC